MASGPYSTFTCRLYRDGLQTPWGFRLQGGKDFNQPLTVQRVFTGSPAEGELQRGDVIIKINNTDVGNLNHKQAQDIIKTPAGQIVLNIQRGQTRFSPVKSVQMQQTPQFQQPTPSGFRSVPFDGSGAPKPYAPPTGGIKPGMNFAVDYTGRIGSPVRRPEQTMINRVHDSLNEAIMLQRTGGENEDDYLYETVNDRKRVFSQDTPKPVVHAPGRPNRSGKVWRPPHQTGSERAPDFGWSPTKRVDPGYQPGPPTQERAYSPPRHTPSRSHQPTFATTHLQDDSGGFPAWKGTLHAPGRAPVQSSVPPPSGGNNKDLDYTKSYAWQMIQQEQGQGQGEPQRTTTTSESQFHSKQSRSFRALEDDMEATDF